jgi:murein L,D-transpeptidase YcbB/YkuD
MSEPPKTARVFDQTLEDALIKYQERNGLEPDGHLGGQTLTALNTPLAVRITQIKTNMERWRHMPEDYPGSHYAVVNIATMNLSIIDGDKMLYKGPVVIGRPDRRTPFIHSTLKTMVINPSWHVPSDLGQKDILPKLRKDPTYLEQQGIEISDNPDDPYGTQIDWKHLPESEFNFRLRQVPGDLNSLGHVKFNFDNPFAVYMHGTPHQDLFDKFERDFSSGCIRLRDPNDVGVVLTSQNKEPWSDERINAQIEVGDTKTVTLMTVVPLSVVYWTVFPDSDGKMDFRKDIYGYDEILGFIMQAHPKARIRLQLQPTEKDKIFLQKIMHPDESAAVISKPALVRAR